MQKWITKIVAFALSALILISTMSWSVEKHLCMGHVMDIAFFHPADNCGMGEGVMETPCCDNESFTLKGQEDLNISWDNLNFGTQQFLVAFSYSYVGLTAIPLDNFVIQITYPPPLLVNDLSLLHEVYLI